MSGSEFRQEKRVQPAFSQETINYTNSLALLSTSLSISLLEEGISQITSSLKGKTEPLSRRREISYPLYYSHHTTVSLDKQVENDCPTFTSYLPLHFVN